MNLFTKRRLMNIKHSFQRVSGVRETRNVVPANQQGPVPCRVDGTHRKEQGRTECACDRQQRHECWPGSALHFPKGKRLSGHTAPRKKAGAQKSILDAAAGHRLTQGTGTGRPPRAGRSASCTRLRAVPTVMTQEPAAWGASHVLEGLMFLSLRICLPLKTASFPTAPCLLLQLSPGFRVSLYDRL